jgi:hypothetical protein
MSKNIGIHIIDGIAILHPCQVVVKRFLSDLEKCVKSTSCVKQQ